MVDPAAVRSVRKADSVLSVRGLTKRFWGTRALDGVNLEIRSGQVRALLGHNGAGKSTLIKILAGVYTADSGGVELDDTPVAAVRDLPIAFIHQDRGLVPDMSVAENIALVCGYECTRWGLVSWSKVAKRARHVLDFLGLDIPPETPVARLDAAESAMLAIARAMSVEARFIVLDEPTATLPATHVDRLIGTIERLRAEGVGFLYVTHRIDEVFRLADTVTVLRDGRVVLDDRVADVRRDDLVQAIVGHELSVSTAKRTPSGAAPALELRDMAVPGVGPVTMRVATGEILGLVGLIGAGHTEIGRLIAGILPPARGSMTFAGRPYAPRSPADALSRGVGFVASDRLGESLAAELSVQENLYLNPVVSGGHILRPRGRRRESLRAHGVVDAYDVRPRSPTTPISLLSGGNQQKIVVARWLEAGLRTLVLEEPTAGVDIAAKEQIHDLLRGAADQAGALVVVSSDFDEVVQLCDRVLVFNRGRLAAELWGEDLRVDSLTSWATGARDEQGSHIRDEGPLT